MQTRRRHDRESSSTGPGVGRDPDLRSAQLAGLAASATATLALGLIHTFASSIPFPPSSIAQVLVRTTPGGFDSFFIDILGHWAQRLALIGTALAFAVVGAPLAAVWHRFLGRRSQTSDASWIALLLPVWVISVVLYPSVVQYAARSLFSVVTLPVYVAVGALAARIRHRLAPAATARQDAAAASPGGDPFDRSRRYFVASLGAGGAGVLLGLSSAGSLLHPRPDPGTKRLALRNLTAAPTAPHQAGGLFANVAGLTPEVTSIAQHYVVDEELFDPVIDPATWRLSVAGHVRRPLRVSYDELKRFPAVERYQTLECISNRVGGHLISTAKWAGVPLPLILRRAGVKPGAVEVVFRAAGGYSDSLPIDQAMDESTLIAIGMNDHVLPRQHGFPARLLSVGTYGMKNPKWLTGIEVVTRPYEGFWEQRGWTKPAIVKTGSRIDTPRQGATVHAPAWIGGIAFAGDRRISKVEVSTDGGSTWSRARLKAPLSPYTWTLWLYKGVPERMHDATILSRAFDGSGRPQARVEVAPFPSGATGYDVITVTA